MKVPILVWILLLFVQKLVHSTTLINTGTVNDLCQGSDESYNVSGYFALSMLYVNGSRNSFIVRELDQSKNMTEIYITQMAGNEHSGHEHCFDRWFRLFTLNYTPIRWFCVLLVCNDDEDDSQQNVFANMSLHKYGEDFSNVPDDIFFFSDLSIDCRMYIEDFIEENSDLKTYKVKDKKGLKNVFRSKRKLKACIANIGFLDEPIIPIEKGAAERNSFKFVSLADFSFYMLVFKSLECYSMFKNYTNLVGVGSVEIVISMRMIDDYISRNQEKCLDMFNTSPYLDIFVVKVKHPAVVLFEIIISFEIIPINVFVTTALLKMTKKNPAAILLCALAVTDACTALSLVFLDAAPYLDFYDLFGSVAQDIARIWYPTYPGCLAYIVATLLRSALHLISVLITMLLCIQKSFAILVPIWSKVHLRKTFWMAMLIGAFLLAFAFFTLVFVQELKGLYLDELCKYDFNNDVFISDAELIIYLVAIVIITVCTLYISCNLTCVRSCKKTFQDSSARKAKNTTSAVMIVLICAVFLSSEAINIIYMFLWRDLKYRIYEMGNSYASFENIDYDNPLYYLEYLNLDLQTMFYIRDICLLFGFGLNFIIYVAMGQQFRQIVKIQLKAICFWRNSKQLK